MKNVNAFTILFSKSIKDAMTQLNSLHGKGIFVVLENGTVVGSITDGDIRRALIRGCTINDQIDLAMKKEFIYGQQGITEKEKKKLILENEILSFPILDNDLRLVDIYSSDEVRDFSDTPVVILAGGMGTRLGKLTENIPKPMIEVAGKPMLERILIKLQEQGFNKFYLAVNYKAEIIEKYFENGASLNCSISYLRENQRLGTAGPLSLLPKNLKTPLVVMNGDLLTQVDLSELLKFHQGHNSKITVGIRQHEFQVPFGVMEVNDGFVKSFIEKPIQVYNVNAGIYIIDPEIIAMIPEEEYYDMSTLINRLLDNEINISCFPIIESWIDIGREADLTHARELFRKGKKL